MIRIPKRFCLFLTLLFLLSCQENIILGEHGIETDPPDADNETSDADEIASDADSETDDADPDGLDTQPDVDPDEEVIELDCGEAVECWQACGTDITCSQNCGEQTCESSQKAYEDLWNCAFKSCISECSDSYSPDCISCVGTNCGAEFLRCNSAECL